VCIGSDKDFVKCILHGTVGTGLNTLVSFESAKNNTPSARNNPTVLDTYLQEEIQRAIRKLKQMLQMLKKG